MTCIAGLVENGHVYLGGDSAAVTNLDLIVRADAKVFRNGGYVFGFTSSFRMGQLLRFAFNPPLPPVDDDLDRFMATTFIDSLREVLKNGGYATKEAGQEQGGTFLVGYQDHLFIVYSDYQVGRPLDSIAAVGCGDTIALGALYATRDVRLEPAQRLERALAAAERFSAGVRAPFTILHT